MAAKAGIKSSTMSKDPLNEPLQLETIPENSNMHLEYSPMDSDSFLKNEANAKGGANSMI